MNLSPATVLDLALLLFLASRAVHGARTGLVLGASGLAGTIIGLFAGLWITPKLLALVPGTSGVLRSLALLGGAWCGAILGKALFARMAVRFRPSRPGSRTRRFDATLGAAATTLVAALLLWFAGAAVRPIVPAGWGRVINDSRVLTTTDELVPDAAKALPGRLTAVLDSRFPQVFSGLSPEPLIPVPAPDVTVANSAAIKAAQKSVVRVSARAPQCDASAVGSGWVVAADRVVTNAHVVAGSNEVGVQVGTSTTRHQASVVAFDPDLDLAILRVDGLDAPALRRAGSLPRGTDTVVAGYPLGGPYTLAGARVRGVVDANGDDIYGGAGVHRQVYSLRTTVQHGNSGGPLLTTDGRVAGTIFARSLADATTGYALTDKATDALLDKAPALTAPVSSQGCAKG